MTGLIPADYQREVDKTTDRLEREYVAEQKRLAAAEKRAERADRAVKSAGPGSAKRQAEKDRVLAQQLVEARRAELGRLQRLMSEAPASSVHRGRKSFRPVPVRHGSAF